MPPETGRVIFEGFAGQQLRDLFGMGIGAELFYSFIIIVCSLMIYFETKELYELSAYKGINYFRQSFLFFAIAFFFRGFIKFLVIYFNLNGIIYLSPITFGITGLITQLFFVYFSSMAIFYILYSVMWKKWNSNFYRIYLFHGFAFLIALFSILSKNPLVYLGLNLFLLLVFLFVVYLSYQEKSQRKKGHNLYLIYILLSIFWILNIIDTLIPKFLQGFQLFIYIISTFVFLLILCRVTKNLGVN